MPLTKSDASIVNQRALDGQVALFSYDARPDIDSNLEIGTYMVADPHTAFHCLYYYYCPTCCADLVVPSAHVCLGKILPCLCPRHSCHSAKPLLLSQEQKSLRTSPQSCEHYSNLEPHSKSQRCALLMPPLRKSQALPRKRHISPPLLQLQLHHPLCYPTDRQTGQTKGNRSWSTTPRCSTASLVFFAFCSPLAAERLSRTGNVLRFFLVFFTEVWGVGQQYFKSNSLSLSLSILSVSLCLLLSTDLSQPFVVVIGIVVARCTHSSSTPHHLIRMYVKYRRGGSIGHQNSTAFLLFGWVGMTAGGGAQGFFFVSFCLLKTLRF